MNERFFVCYAAEQFVYLLYEFGTLDSSDAVRIRVDALGIQAAFLHLLGRCISPLCNDAVYARMEHVSAPFDGRSGSCTRLFCFD